MHILTYCDEDLGIAAGGSRQVLEFAKALAVRGHDVTVVAPESEQLSLGISVTPPIRIQMVPVIRWGGLRPVSFLLSSKRILTRLLRDATPDVLLWFDSPGQIAPLWALQKNSCPVVYFVNGLPSEEVQGMWRLAPFLSLLSHGLRLATRNANVIVSVCPELFHSLKSIEPIDSGKCTVIKNGVDPVHFSPQPHHMARRELSLVDQGPYIGFVGGFFPWHGLDTLVDAIAIVVKSHPTVQCLLVGEGQTQLALKAQVERLRLSRHIHFVGRTDFDNVPKWIAACDVCVVLHRQTRSYPGDSMKLWEYLACGRPVVATAGPGYGDVVVDFRCGLSVQADDHDDLAHQIITLLDNPELRAKMGQRGRSAVVQTHTWSTRAVQLEQVCQQAIGRTALAA
ncbi:MAG: glycosyltransferase family 4 protein [Nitrospira sp.]|nr:glycosyltransferase family 4 protein [Nitrospira sp.]